MNWDKLNQTIIACRKCPRLVEYREQAPPKKPYENEVYWRRPVPGFGDPDAWLLIAGLAPSTHGGNRTGRIFTGDKSSDFLFQELYKAGLASQPTSRYKDDGLVLTGCYITPVVKCAPPKDKPTRQECLNCHGYFQNEMRLLKKVTHILVLGGMAFTAIKWSLPFLKGRPFKHGACYKTEGAAPAVYLSYHPSPQNTNTGKLTSDMFQGLLQAIINNEVH